MMGITGLMGGAKATAFDVRNMVAGGGEREGQFMSLSPFSLSS